jgi:hypothetical protein
VRRRNCSKTSREDFTNYLQPPEGNEEFIDGDEVKLGLPKWNQFYEECLTRSQRVGESSKVLYA